MSPAVLAALLFATSPLWQPQEGTALIGTPAPELEEIVWLQGGPHQIKDLRGSVVLIRFWLVGCPYCSATAPSLNALHEKYKDRGLVVIGLHHPKSDEARKADVVRKVAREYNFEFAIGQDNSWKTIRAYGVSTHFKRFTSLSFLIAPDGEIAFVHDGGEYHEGGGKKHVECNAAYEALESHIEALLPQRKQ